MAYIGPMYMWRISIFGKTPAVPLGTVTAPDEATARQQAIDFYGIAENQRFRVVAVQIAEQMKKPAKAKVGAKS
jgi:hypothetical protein